MSNANTNKEESRISKTMTMQPTEPIPAKSTIVKTDKPRPHVCLTCTRSFARLEHLKRHERSHTKEKPFQCPVCERSFARRDLLLRHRQKLHANFTDAAGNPTNMANKADKSRKRKQSVTAQQQRPQAEAIKQELSSQNAPHLNLHGTNGPPGLHNDLVAGVTNSFANSGLLQQPIDHRNVPDQMFRNSNPNIMNFSDGSVVLSKGNNTNGSSLLTPSTDRESPHFTEMAPNGRLVPPRTRHSSFSATSAASYSKFKDVEVLNGSSFHPIGPQQVNFSTPQLMPVHLTDNDELRDLEFMDLSGNDALFINPQLLGAADGTNNQFGDDIGWMSHPSGQPAELHQQPWKNSFQFEQSHMGDSQPASNHIGGGPDGNASGNNVGLSPFSISMSPDNQNGVNLQLNSPSDSGASELFNIDMTFEDGHNFDDALQGAQSHMTFSPTFNAHHISHLQSFQSYIPQEENVSGSLIVTPRLRLHILTILSAPNPFTASHRSSHLPSTLELQQYVNLYVEHFGKHFPFIHTTQQLTNDNAPLMLSMAGLGALYTGDYENATSIFEVCRCCVHVYLEARREAKKSKPKQVTPLWLVQSLILGVIFGLFASEQLANEIAVAQTSAIISLAKSAGLHLSPSQILGPEPAESAPLELRWKYFIAKEERVRSMHVLFIVSSLLATAYGQGNQALTGEQLLCGYPCNEDLWLATSAAEWVGLWQQGESSPLSPMNDMSPSTPVSVTQRAPGVKVEDHKQQQQQQQQMSQYSSKPTKSFPDLIKELYTGPPSQPLSPFTVLSLVYAIHMEIYTNPSEDKLVLLRNWEQGFAASPFASLSPNSKFGPMMSDGIPLSSLAHIRIFLNLRPVKEMFWKREFSSMGKELDGMNGDLFNCASFSCDTISLWEKYSSSSKIFIHTLTALFDCTLIVSEFLHRLESRGSPFSEDEGKLVNRIHKVLQRSLDSDRIEQNLSVLTLEIVSKIISKNYIWPFALVMADALRTRIDQIRFSNSRLET